MTDAPDRADLEHVCDLVAERLGLRFDSDRIGDLADAWRARRRETACASAEEYLERLLDPASSRRELFALADRITVPESSFFRVPEHFRVLVDVALPERMRARAAERRLRILSAGCATGEEPYSIAIALRERQAELAGWDVAIEGIDLSAASLEAARRGSYSAWRLRGVEGRVLDRYFHPEGAEHELDASVRAMVRFEQRNLLEEDAGFWRPGSFDVIFCRNVVIYFSPEALAATVRRLARSLAPGGFLFLGHSESLRGISDAFRLRRTDESFYYQLRDGSPDVPDAVGEGAPLPGQEPWFEAVRRSAERIAGLPDAPPRAPLTGAPLAPLAPIALEPSGARLADAESPGARIAQATLHFRAERFADALEVLQSLPPAARSDPDTELLLAVVATSKGDLVAGEATCRRLLARDGLDEGAHYVLALCREQAGDHAAALEHYRAAVHLDPTFAMPRLHAGLLARRAGDAATARRDLALALALLERENASRILLFGGGFGRDALVQLCRSALDSCGGAP